ncbi:MAG: DUF937 domain-containing protein [Acidimicrobiia bacterium]
MPALLGGMKANAEDPMGAASLQQAFGQHAGDPFEGLDLSRVDKADGEKIVDHVFGDNRQEVVKRLGGQALPGGIIGKLLPILAPLIMSWLAGKMTGGPQPKSAPAGGGGGGGLDDLLGGGGMGDLLGGLLGGGDDGDDIGDLLGGLLGGGTKR